jgi:hypothetical protein
MPAEGTPYGGGTPARDQQRRRRRSISPYGRLVR